MMQELVLKMIHCKASSYYGQLARPLLSNVCEAMQFNLGWVENKKRGPQSPVIGYVYDRAAPGQHRDAPSWSNGRIQRRY